MERPASPRDPPSAGHIPIAGGRGMGTGAATLSCSACLRVIELAGFVLRVESLDLARPFSAADLFPEGAEE